MADFTSDKKYNYLWQNSKFKDFAQSGSLISQFVNDAGYVTSSVAISASYALTASYLTGTITSASYAISASHAQTASYFAGTVTSASYALTASYADTSSFSTAATANIILVLNQSGNPIPKGTVVHITASGNSSDTPRVITASYENDNASANTLGISTQLIANGSTGFVTTEGVITGINTNAFQSGQLVYLGATGSITGSAPLAPLHSVRLGQVVREQSNNGSIYVRIDNGYELGELHDVRDFTTTSSYGDLLVRSGSIWTNLKQLTGSYGLTGSLSATSFTGSLLGTASYATTALSASYAPVTPPFPYTGSAGITGSLTVVGSTTSTQIGAGAAPSGSVRLDIRAQGALSTDIALRTRNSTDTYNILAVQGDGNIQIGSDAVGATRTTTIAASNTSQVVLDTSYSTDTATIGVSRRITPLYNTNTLLFSQNAFADGNVQPYRFHFVNPSNYWGYNQPGWTIIYDAGFMWHKDSATFANLQMKLTPDNVLTIYTGSVTPSGTGTSAIPTEVSLTGSGFQMWASGSAGNAKPYFKTQNGTLLYLGDQSRLFNVTASNITASSVVSSFTGSLTGSVTNYETAWTPYTPVWTAASVNPVIGNGTIEGWYKVIGKTCFVRGNIAMGSTTTFGSGEWYVSMPFTASHADAILMSANLLDNGSAWYNATVNGARAGFNYKSTIQYQAVGGTADSITPTTPFTWTNTDRFLWNGTYELI